MDSTKDERPRSRTTIESSTKNVANSNNNNADNTINNSSNPKPRSVTANSLSSASFAQYNDVDTPQTPPPQAVKAKQFIKIIDFTVYYRVSVSPVVLYKIAVDVEHEKDDPSYYTAKSFRNLKSLIKKASEMYAKGQGHLSIPNPVNPNLMEELSDDEDNDATTEHSSSLHFMPTVFQNSVSWIIFRRYNNFRKLYKQLLKLSLMGQYTEEYAALAAVPLPKKRLFGNLEEKVIHSRMFALNKLLSVICEYYNLFKSEPAQHFILPNNDKLYLKDITIDALFSQQMLVQQQEYMQNKQIQFQREQKLTVKTSSSDFQSEILSAINQSIILPAESDSIQTIQPNENVQTVPLTPEELERKTLEDRNNQILFEQWLKRVCRCEICEKDHSPQDMISIDTCMHNFCYDCMKAYIDSKLHDQNVSILDFECPAPQCNSQIPYSVIKALSMHNHDNAGVSQIDRLIEDTFHRAIESSEGIIRCPNKNCKFRMERVKYDSSSPEYQLEITKRSLELQGVLQNVGLDVMMEIIGCEMDNRFRCRACGTEFCASCNAIPFHHKYTCKQRKSQKCRYCGSSEQLSSMPVDESTLKYRDQLVSSDSSGVAFVCSKDECKLKCSRSCKKILPCGHYCGGVDKEPHCLPCLNEDCASQKNNENQDPKQNADDLCNMCWVEDLGSAPCLQLECGHIFHHECIVNTLDKRWPGPRITFGFMCCPLCKKPMTHPLLHSVIEPIMEYRKEVEFRALDRLKYEGLQSDPRIESKYGKNALEFAMDTLSYFECYKCKKPYFGGLKACNDGLDRAFDERELVCAGCSGSNLVQSCPKHGTAFIEFKCKFCCSVGTWFCWGTTHFCDSCHNLQLQHNYLNLKKEDEFPRCKGRDYCPLKVDHPHFQEFCLGCSVCKYAQEKM